MFMAQKTFVLGLGWTFGFPVLKHFTSTINCPYFCLDADLLPSIQSHICVYAAILLSEDHDNDTAKRSRRSHITVDYGESCTFNKWGWSGSLDCSAFVNVSQVRNWLKGGTDRLNIQMDNAWPYIVNCDTAAATSTRSPTTASVTVASKYSELRQWLTASPFLPPPRPFSNSGPTRKSQIRSSNHLHKMPHSG